MTYGIEQASNAKALGMAADRAVDRPEKLSYYTRKAVETSAENAARENRTPLDACPYRMDFAPAEFQHWMAVFLVAGGRVS